MQMLIAMFVAGLFGGSAVGYGLARRSCPGSRRVLGPAHGPQFVRRAPTHPALSRPALYDWDKDGAA